jgi:hypothetical protein
MDKGRCKDLTMLNGSLRASLLLSAPLMVIPAKGAGGWVQPAVQDGVQSFKPKA